MMKGGNLFAHSSYFSLASLGPPWEARSVVASQENEMLHV